MSVLRSNAAHMAGGFLLMGGWAMFANRDHPMPAPVVAGFTQGAVTALITLGLKRVVESLALRLRGWLGMILPPILACAFSVTLLFTLHSAARTPEVWATLALPSCVATLYAALYTYRIRNTP